MKEEPDIVKELKEAEKSGLLQSMIQSTFGDLEEPNESIEKTSGQISHMIGDREKRTNEQDSGCVDEKYRTIFENYAVAITLADNKERIVSWNKYAEELLNMNEKELFMRPVETLYPTGEWDKIRKENIRQKGMKYKLETKINRKDKEPLDVELSLCVLKGRETNIAGSIGIIRDITKLKNTERKLIESEEKYKTIFENSAVAITLTDENEKIISWNKYAEKLLGLDKNELNMRPIESLYPPKEWEKIRKKNIRQKGMQYHLETKILRENNELIDIDISISVLKNHEGKVIGSIGVIEDITERKQIEKALEVSEEKFKQLYEKAPVPYHTISPGGEITSVNEKWCRTLGFEKEEVVNRSIFKFVAEKEREIAESSFKEKIRCKKPYTGGHERTFITKDGVEKIFLIHDFLLYDIDKNTISIHTTMEDITERKMIEEQLKQLNENLELKVQERIVEVENLLQQKDEFVNQLSHDLRSPLTPLVNLIPLLEKTEKGPISKELLEVLRRNINRMKNIVSKTLKLAELNAPSTMFDLKDINLWEAADNSIKDQQLVCDGKDFTVKNKVDENIFIKADKLQLNEVFGNLISNAVKYSPPGCTITVDAHDDGDFVTVSIMDSGDGLTSEQINYVFDEFYKADESRHDLESSGLGLSICKRIVEKHGGRIWAESPGLGRGSIFCFTIPIGSKISKEDISEKVKGDNRLLEKKGERGDDEKENNGG